MNNSVLKKIFIGTMAIMCVMTTTAFAVSSTTYQGWGIRGWRSVGRVTANSSVSVSHKNISWNNVGANAKQMDVSAEESVWWGWNRVGTKSTYGTGTTSFSFNSIPSGTYSLYFEAPIGPAAADISGSFSGN